MTLQFPAHFFTPKITQSHKKYVILGVKDYAGNCKNGPKKLTLEKLQNFWRIFQVHCYWVGDIYIYIYILVLVLTTIAIITYYILPTT